MFKMHILDLLSITLHDIGVQFSGLDPGFSEHYGPLQDVGANPSCQICPRKSTSGSRGGGPRGPGPLPDPRF